MLAADEFTEYITASISDLKTFKVIVYLVVIDRLEVKLKKRREVWNSFYSKSSLSNNLMNNF